MSETPTKARGLSGAGLRSWALALYGLGIFGMAVLERGYLQTDLLTGEELLQVLQTSPDKMAATTAALVLRALSGCAIPLYAFLLTEGFGHTASYKLYLLRVLGVAAASEIPYNFAVSGRLLDTGTRNPAFALAVALVMLFFFRNYEGKGATGLLVGFLVTAAGFLWTIMLRVADGPAILLMTAAFWFLGKKPQLRALGGCMAAFACTIFSYYYAASPMALLLVHLYNGQRGEQNRTANMLMVPLMLAILGLLPLVLF